MKGLVSAITSPLTDILRPTRKETFGLTRVGALGTSVPQHTPKPEDKIQPTIKETTTYSPYSKGQRPYKPVTDGGYQVSDHQPVSNQRDSTNVFLGAHYRKLFPMKQNIIHLLNLPVLMKEELQVEILKCILRT
jgi:hypothetical protein